jgi:hypothetical protein
MTAAAETTIQGNRDFIDAIFAGMRADERVWTAQFKTSPSVASREQWAGLPVGPGYRNQNPSHVGWNHYFSVATLKANDTGEIHRRRECFSRLFVLVLDDATPIPGIDPTWVLETSLKDNGESNVQIGYKLATPIDDITLATYLHKALKDAGRIVQADKNGNNPVRYVRLPWGCNTKVSPPHQNKLLYWSPESVVEVDALVAALGIDLSAMPADDAAPSVAIVDVIPAGALAEWQPKARKLAWDGALRTHNDPKLGRNNEIFRLGTYAARDRLPEEALEFVLQEFVARMRPTNTAGKPAAVNWGNERATIRRGYVQGHKDGVPKLVDIGFLNNIGTTGHEDSLESTLGIGRINAKAQTRSIIPSEKRRVREFPIQDLNDTAAWMTAIAPVSYPEVTQHAILGLIGAAASRLYITPQGDPLSLYLGASARSIGELRYTHHAIHDAMRHAGLRRMVRMSRFTSPQTILKTLMRSPASIYLSDDYGGLSAFARRQPSGLQEQALATIASVYDGHSIQLDGPEDAGFRPGSAQVQDEQPIIMAPALNMFGLVGDDHLATLMRASELGRGALEQLLLVLADPDCAVVHDPMQLDPPDFLIRKLRTIRHVPDPNGLDLTLATIFGDLAGEMLPNQITVAFTADLDAIYAELAQVSTDRRVRPLLLAARGMVRRIAGSLAVWENPQTPVADARLIEWAGGYVIDRMRDLVDRFALLHGDDGRPTAYDQVLMKVTEAKDQGVPRRDLVSGCRAYRNLSNDKREELIQQMLGDETVFEMDIKCEGKGRPRKRLVSAKYIRGEG